MAAIETMFFGEAARKIAQYLDLKCVGDTVDVNTKLVFTKRSRSGRSVIILEFNI